MHKLAMVLAASRSSELILTADTLAFADGMISSLEKDMPQVFSTIGQNDVTRGMSELVNIVLTKREITQDTLYRNLFRTMSAHEFHNALNSAVLAGYLRIESRGNTNYIIALEPHPHSGD